MWFYGGVGLADHGYWGATSQQAIGYATSPDGIDWTVHNGPVLTSTQSWEGSTVVNPAVIRTDAGDEMWYVGYSNGVGLLGYATSPDGIAWTKDGRNPVLGLPGWAGGYQLLLFPSVLREGDNDRIWYSAWRSIPDEARIGTATRQIP